MSTILVIGIKESASVNNIIVILKVTIILLIVAVGSDTSILRTTNRSSYRTRRVGHVRYLRRAARRGTRLLRLHRIRRRLHGAQEARNPQKDMPIGILGSLAICTILYIVVSAILVGMVPYSELNLPAPVAYAMEKVARRTGFVSRSTSAPCSASRR